MLRRHRYRAPGFVYIFSVAIFLLATTAALLAARGYTLDLRSGSVYKTGLLIVRSNPPGAYITLNNHLRREHTPSRLQLRPGSYHIKVDKPGVRAYERQFTITAEQADFSENITLWKSQPTVKPVAQNVVAEAISNDRSKLVYLQTVPEGVAVFVTRPTDQPSRIATLAAPYRTPTSLRFNSDATVVVVSTATESTLLPLGGTPATIAIGGQVSFLPGSRDRLIARRGGELLVADQAAALLVGDITAWSSTAQALYIASSDGQVTRIDPRSGNRRLLGHTAPLTELVSPSQADMAFGKDASGTLYSFEPKSDTAREIAQGVDEFHLSPDGSALGIRSGQELKEWLSDTRSVKLVTRFTDLFSSPEPAVGGHYLTFVQGGNLHAIANDGSNDTNLTSVTEGSALLHDTQLTQVVNGELQLVSLLDH